MSNSFERFIAKRIKGGLVNVFVLERKCRELMPLLAFASVLFIPVLVIALFK